MNSGFNKDEHGQTSFAEPNCVRLNKTSLTMLALFPSEAALPEEYL